MSLNIQSAIKAMKKTGCIIVNGNSFFKLLPPDNTCNHWRLMRKYNDWRFGDVSVSELESNKYKILMDEYGKTIKP